MAKVAQVLADSASTRATRKEAMDYVETILAGKNRKSAAEVQQMDREALKDYVAQMAKRKKETIR